MEAKDAIEYDDDGGLNGQSRKRKEPDSGRDENSNSLNLANAQRVEQLNQWIQVRSAPANDFRRPIRIWTRFSTTITKHYHTTISYWAYWIFRGYHSKEVGSTWNITYSL